MSAPVRLSECSVGIVGMGLMGGSLAMVLKDRCMKLNGIDQDEPTRQKALQLGLVTEAWQEIGALAQADLIILATPVMNILEILQEIPEIHPGEAVILDLGSTKTDIVAAMSTLPKRFEAVGGHPMCGKEKLGLENAEETLFEGSVFSLAETRRSGERSKMLVREIVQACNAREFWVEAQTHDRWAAATSHLPYLLSCILAIVTPDEVQPLVGPGFRSSARLAATPLSMMMDVLITNRENVLKALQEFQDCSQRIYQILEGEDYAALQVELKDAALHQRALVEGGE